MAQVQPPIDWREVTEGPAADASVDTRKRLRWVLTIFAAALAIVLVRAAQLEISDGENFRRLAARPLEHTVTLTARRGSILARDGTPLAADQRATGLAVQFRYLEKPPDPAWLRRMARARLSRAERRRPEQLAAMEHTIRDELADVRRRLAGLCEVSEAQWQARSDRIARRVNQLAARIDARRLDRFHERGAAEAPAGPLTVAAVMTGLFAPPERLPPPPVLLAEQTAYHRLVDEVPPAAVEAIQNNPEAYPGAKIVEFTRRRYPLESVAANIVGHVGWHDAVDAKVVPSETGDKRDLQAGLLGVERRLEGVLAGTSGSETQLTDHRGKLLSTKDKREPVAGRDVMLSIDAALQRGAEGLLERWLRHLDGRSNEKSTERHGGAIVVLDVRSGEILAAASAPRFDPNLFAAGDPAVERVLADPRQPLFDRAAKMAIPPGSVFKPLTAVALVANSVVDPRTPFFCQGYFDEPDRLRCQMFRHQGIGHGDVTLFDALAQSCNVYFFHHAAALGAPPLVDWAGRFGFGEPTGVELDEASGHLPQSSEVRETSQTQMLAIGQGTLTATPLQIARFYAAIANGGHLIAPRLVRSVTGGPGDQCSASTRIAGLDDATLEAVREGLVRVVADPNGTAFATVRLPWVAIAGKTGTAETGGGRSDHAWFAGYVPAEAPRYAFVVALEHAGSGATAAGSLARSLVERLRQLGYLTAPATADRAFPPGKG
jgi:penicillin-binding protein 2